MAATSRVNAGLPSLLRPNDPDVSQTLNPDGTAPILLVCCHAGKAVPAALGDLGLDPDARSRHIGWDIGAEPLTRKLSQRLDAAAILGTYSRLVVDPNRVPGAIDSIPEISDGTTVPGNVGLSESDQAQRLHSIFWPYHNAVAEAYAERLKTNPHCALVAIHTFTPQMNGCTVRPWEAGILWNRDERLARPMIEHMQAEAGLTVGDNEPYSGREFGFTVDYHAGNAGRPHVSIEVRQDLVLSEMQIEAWTDILAGALSHALRTAGLWDDAPEEPLTIGHRDRIAAPGTA